MYCSIGMLLTLITSDLITNTSEWTFIALMEIRVIIILLRVEKGEADTFRSISYVIANTNTIIILGNIVPFYLCSLFALSTTFLIAFTAYFRAAMVF